jgi:hypothetical protein
VKPHLRLQWRLALPRESYSPFVSLSSITRCTCLKMKT